MNTPAMAQIAEGVVRAEVTSAFPKYRQIIDALAGAIEHGTLIPGDRLPPETSMARLFSVSLVTVQKALAHLADSGALHRTRRRGTFVAGRQAEDVFVFRFRNPETGTVLVPFTHVLSVSEDRSEGPWREHLDAERRDVEAIEDSKTVVGPESQLPYVFSEQCRAFERLAVTRLDVRLVIYNEDIHAHF